MRAMFLCLATSAVLVIGGTSSSGGDKKDPGAAALKKLQGTWKFTVHEMDGKSTPPEDVAKMTIAFTGDKWSVRQEDKEVQAGTHKLDPTKKPGHVDAVVTEGPDKDVTMLGIFELKGDTMKVCFDPMGKARPTSFSSKDGRFLAVVQRVKKE